MNKTVNCAKVITYVIALVLASVAFVYTLQWVGSSYGENKASYNSVNVEVSE